MTFSAHGVARNCVFGPVAPRPPGGGPPAAAPTHEHLLARVHAPVPVLARPGGTRVATLGATTAFGSARVLSVLRRSGHWLRVTTADLQDGQDGWIDENAPGVTISATPVEIVIRLAARTLELRRDGHVLRRFTVGVGAPGSPTPTGRFAVTDELVGARLQPGLRLLHPRALGPPDTASVGLDRRRPDRHPRHERAVDDRTGALVRLRSRGGRRPALSDAARPARDARLDLPRPKALQRPRAEAALRSAGPSAEAGEAGRASPRSRRRRSSRRPRGHEPASVPREPSPRPPSSAAPITTAAATIPTKTRLGEAGSETETGACEASGTARIAAVDAAAPVANAAQSAQRARCASSSAPSSSESSPSRRSDAQKRARAHSCPPEASIG